ncbi:MAG: hypothetical protein U0575_03390 [Phycisphaerales bacterium]
MAHGEIGADWLPGVAHRTGVGAERTRCSPPVGEEARGTDSRTMCAIVAGTDPAVFQAPATKANAGCPASKVFKAAITLDAALVQ